MTGQDARLVRQLHDDVHHGVADRPGVGPAADRVLEQDVAGERDLAVRDERQVVVLVPGRRQRLEAEPARLQRPFDDLEPVALAQLVVAGDVVAVGVGRQQVRHVQPFALDELVERLERRARVDEDGGPAGPVRDQVRV